MKLPDGFVFISRLKNCTTIELEQRNLVMCKSCRYYNTVGCADGFGWCENPIVNHGVYDDFFYAKGEKNEE